MDSKRIARRPGDRGEGKGIIELAGGALEIDSFTTPGVRYKVHPESGYCSCPRFFHKGNCAKHVVLGEAVLEARSVRFGKRAAEENVIELCQRIFAPIKTGEHCIDSYELLLEVMAYRFSTDAMIREVLRRHHRVLAMHERRAA